MCAAEGLHSPETWFFSSALSLSLFLLPDWFITEAWWDWFWPHAPANGSIALCGAEVIRTGRRDSEVINLRRRWWIMLKIQNGGLRLKKGLMGNGIIYTNFTKAYSGSFGFFLKGQEQKQQRRRLASQLTVQPKKSLTVVLVASYTKYWHPICPIHPESSIELILITRNCCSS